MNRSVTVLPVALFSAILLVVAIPAGVAAKSAPMKAPNSNTGNHPPNGKSTPKPEAHHTIIEAISADSITIKGKESKTFKITKDTELNFKGQRVKVEELKVGMRVSVSPGSDPAVAARISAEEAPKS